MATPLGATRPSLNPAAVLGERVACPPQPRIAFPTFETCEPAGKTEYCLLERRQNRTISWLNLKRPGLRNGCVRFVYPDNLTLIRHEDQGDSRQTLRTVFIGREWLLPTECAASVDVSTKHLERLTACGDLPCNRELGRPMIHVGVFRAWLLNRYVRARWQKVDERDVRAILDAGLVLRPEVTR